MSQIDPPLPTIDDEDVDGDLSIRVIHHGTNRVEYATLEQLAQSDAFGDAIASNPSLASQFLSFLKAAAQPDLLISGTITRDTNDYVTSAQVVWPDGVVGTYTPTYSATFPGTVVSYTITYGSGPVIYTYTQPTMTLNANGVVTTRPAIVRT